MLFKLAPVPRPLNTRTTCLLIRTLTLSSSVVSKSKDSTEEPKSIMVLEKPPDPEPAAQQPRQHRGRQFWLADQPPHLAAVPQCPQ